MTLPSYTVDQFTLSSALPKGFIEIPTLSTKPKLMLINVSSIAHIKVRDSKTCITLLPHSSFIGAKSIMTSRTYDQVKAMIAKAQ